MRYLFTFFAGVLLCAAAQILMIHVQEGVPTSSSKWAADLYQLKERHAKKYSTEKLLILSGSNSLFGIYTPALENAYGVPTTNFGVHAGLGLRYILDRSKRALNSGDIVYLPLEYALYQDSEIPSPQLMDFLIARDPHYFRTLPIRERILGYTSLPISRIVEGLQGGSDRYQGQSAKLYNVANVDESGNQLQQSVSPQMSNRGQLATLKAKDISDGNLTSHSQRVLSEYFAWARKHNICVIGGPPNLLDDPEYHSARFDQFFKVVLDFYASNDVPFAGHPSNYLLPIDLFFDTEYHLNAKGIKLRTELTISHLGEDPRSLCGRYDA
ncbi:hypothetical protein Mag101_00545 [Microbulbifer agarilyticus]|uniref:SGNH hydrolase-type esterase domain-containing protein n=2 Tax=Microbulbifer agarilyticus TaxID=260552 RepID=A0A1Q2M0S9_9GAMM|nr:hypothetical protein Mag101_00545 [Microbulbifer agarilyticus]